MISTDIVNLKYFVPVIVVFTICLLIVLTKDWHGKHSLDSNNGVQKFHHVPTPRIGGVALFLGLIAAWFVSNKSVRDLIGPMLISSIPAFFAGLLEDLTKRVGVKERLLATMLSGLMAFWLTGYTLNKVEVVGVDLFLSWLPLSVLFTVFAVGGIANSVNIIDGFNGLAGGTLIISFGAFYLISIHVGDTTLATICLFMIAALCGFIMLNFPFGKIFMGDGGAYLMGFFLAWIAVMLPMRNMSVSKWASLLVCGYPLIETLFSMTRRLVKKAPAGQADSEHLHSMIKVKLVRRYFRFLPPTIRNSTVSPFCWAFSISLAILAVNNYGQKELLIISAITGLIIYATIHGILHRLKSVE
jgi:UDP-N-acetylmuramyl pentapeptide phosphotransferase/UDP-N-acetylglucosamine-1-phosphate transferase